MGSALSCKSSNNIYPRPEIDIEYGRIQGKHFVLTDERVADVYLGIPFAKPPIGNLRFEKPQPADSWHPKTKPTIKYKSRPIQNDYCWDGIQTGVGKGEDCLYLNIMMPNWNPPSSSKGFPVMVYIHGGGFVMESAARIKYENVCNNIISNDVIFVTIEYRLGILGFFTTDDEIATGNYGIWDQCMALKFIKKNIANFKGDPNNITLMGQSAGGVSVDLLALSPYTRDLFDKIIIMGGNSECIWAMSPRCRVAKNCRERAMELGFQKPNDGAKWTKEDNKALMEYLRNQPANNLGATMLFRKDLIESVQLFVSPSIDGDFFPKNLSELRDEAPKKKIIVGETEFESLLFISIGQVKINKKLMQFFCDRTKTVLQQLDQISDKSKTALTYQKWENLYGISEGQVKNKKDLIDTAVAISSDLINTIPMYNFIQKSLQKGSKVYAFNFVHYNWQAMLGIRFYLPKKGATHAAEITSLFDVNYYVLPFTRTEADKKVTTLLATFFTNFAKTGNPNGDETTNPFSASFNIKWDCVKRENPINCLTICENPKMEEVERLKRCIPQAEAYAALQEWVTIMDEETYLKFKGNVKIEMKK